MFTYAVVLTGGIATGKSTVSACLKKAGFEVIDADSIAHDVLKQQTSNVVCLFGESVVKEGEVDKKALGAIVFSDSKKRKILEELLHPLIYDEILRLSLIFDAKKQLYFIDIPLFFETNRYPIKKILLVYVPAKIQLERLIFRDKFEKEEALKRINSQMDIEKKVEMASYVIDNSGTIEELKKRCNKTLKEIMGVFNDSN